MTIRESARAMRLRIESGDLLTLDEAVAACVTRDEALSVFELVENIPEEDAIRISCCGALASITDGIFGAKVECPRCHAKAVDATSPMWSPLLERGNSYISLPSDAFLARFGSRNWLVVHEGNR